MINTDIIIIGAGPVGLFTIFEAGLMKLKCHIIDALPQVGGQLYEIYPQKPIYDIPGFPCILAKDLIENLMIQARPFNPGFTLGDSAETITKNLEGYFEVTTSSGLAHKAPVVIIAGGLGRFEPRKPPLLNLNLFENIGVEYMVKNPEQFKNKDLLISGGGDSALDWAIYFSKNHAKTITLIHRSAQFRAHPDSVIQIYNLKEKGQLKIIENAEVIGIDYNENQKIKLKINHLISGDFENMIVDKWLPLFGLLPKLGPIINWGLALEKNAIIVNNALDYQSSTEGIFAVGDINTYSGKLKLILCGFHEATMAVQSAYKLVYPTKKFTMKYTTVNGIEAF
jgi:thioredoxin reductase (NADPH)